MPDEYMQHIFEPFARAKDESISKIQGTGLGLAITQNIVQMMNGTIEVQSRPGTGSIFTVSVPLELQLKEEQEHEELNGLPVLVVDDELAVCESAAMLLQELGMRGSWVLSGAEAVERVVEAHERRDDFYAVILDWKMPDMDGLETVRVIRKRVGAKVPIIIISAYDYSNIEKEFIDAGPMLLSASRYLSLKCCMYCSCFVIPVKILVTARLFRSCIRNWQGKGCCWLRITS